jgi:preprotein translocase subunit SecD
MRFRPNSSASVYLAAAAVVCSSSGCESRSASKALGSAATLELQLVSTTNVPNSRQATDLNSDATIYLTSPAVITSADVATVQRSEDSQQRPSLTVNLTPTGAQKLVTATTPATGQKLAVVANGEVISVATVYSPLSNSVQISGGPVQQDRERIFESLTKD